MMKALLALTVSVVASTAAVASTSGDLAGRPTLATNHQIQTAPGGFTESKMDRSSEGRIILAKGDESASGPGLGGQKGKKMGGGKGKQKEGKFNKGKGKGNS